MNRSLPLFAVLIAGSAWAARAPKWVSGADPAYPETAYVIGVGIGDDLEGARANGRAEISRAFHARVQQTVVETQTESSASLGSRRGPAAGTQTSAMTTQVTTESLLEGVQIKETWIDTKKKKHYALALLDRRATTRALSHDITEKEEAIAARLAEAEDAETPLSRARALGRALVPARQRDALVLRRRVVDTNPAPDLPGETSTAQIDGKLSKILSGVQFRVETADGAASRLHKAVAGRVAELGFKVTDVPKAPLAVKCSLAVTPFDRGHPQWKFYHWEGTVELMEGANIIASSTPSGEDGHLMEKTAETKARASGEEGIAQEAQKLISQYVFGE